jgi:hypothetical protein
MDFAREIRDLPVAREAELAITGQRIEDASREIKVV